MIHLIVGNTGSGKTTYSKTLKEKNGGVIFSIDQWNNSLFLPDKKESDGLEWMLERIDRAESLMMTLMLQLEAAEVDTILDLGLSKKSHRDKFRSFAEKHNIKYTLHYLDIPSETRRNRVIRRNAEKSETFEFEVSNEMFEFMEGYFEAPLEEELKGGVLIKH